MHLLGGSWVVISGVISPLVWVVSIVTLLITLLITTHEPPSMNLSLSFRSLGIAALLLWQTLSRVSRYVFYINKQDQHKSSYVPKSEAPNKGYQGVGFRV